MISLDTIDAVFARLALRFGSAWRAKWDGLDMQDVAADWHRVLVGMSRDQILYGLEAMPEFPPTAHQFREACYRMPDKEEQARIALDSTPPPAAVLAELARVGSASRYDPKAWAYALQDAEFNRGGEFNGRRMTPAQRTMWRAALLAGDSIETPDDGRTAKLKAESARKVAAYTGSKTAA